MHYVNGFVTEPDDRAFVEDDFGQANLDFQQFIRVLSRFLQRPATVSDQQVPGPFVGDQLCFWEETRAVDMVGMAYRVDEKADSCRAMLFSEVDNLPCF